MRTPRYVKPEPAVLDPVGQHPLPISRPIALYYRQSQFSQIGNTSTTFQLEDFPQYILSLGWTQDKLIMIEEDAGISGTKDIRARPGMSRLFDLIISGHLGAVACTDEDRLFRDMTQIQVNLFIQACREMDVRVITPSMVYNFTSESSRAFHSRQFRFKSEQAAEFIHLVTRGRLYAARQRKVAEGRWIGGVIPVGFILDDRKILPNGEKNPHWQKLVPFAPYADVVRAYFELFRKLDCSLAKTFQHIEQYGPDYPDFASEEIRRQVPQGHRLLKPSIKPILGRYYPKHGSLTYLFTNASYAGHYIFQNQVVRWNNHPAIIPEELFLAVFKAVSPMTLDGEPNTSYVKSARNRSIIAQHADRARPLCEGLLFSVKNGTYLPPRVQWDEANNTYRYFLQSDTKGRYWRKKAEYIDEAVVQRLKDKLHATFEASNWEALLESVALPNVREIMQQRQDLELEISSILDNISATVEEKVLDAAQLELFRLISQREQMAISPLTMPNKAQFIESLLSFRRQYETKVENWRGLSIQQQQTMLKTFIENITVVAPAPCTLELVIHWRDQTTTSFLLSHQGQVKNKVRRFWMKHEIDLVASLLETNASQLEIMAAVPDRAWGSIHKMVRQKLGKVLIVSPKPVYDLETFADYQTRTQGENQNYRSRPGQRWSDNDINHLQTLLARDADNLTIANAFPHRTWIAIKKLIWKLYGRNYPLRSDNKIQSDETIEMYWSRTKGVPNPVFKRAVEQTSLKAGSVQPFDVITLIQKGHAFESDSFSRGD